MRNVQAKIRRIHNRLERDTALLNYYTSTIEEETAPIFSPYIHEPSTLDKIIPAFATITGFSLLVLLFAGVI